MVLAVMDGKYLDEAILGYVDHPTDGLTTVYGYPQLIEAFAKQFGEDADEDEEDELIDMAREWIDYNCTSGPVLILYPADRDGIDALADEDA